METITLVFMISTLTTLAPGLILGFISAVFPLNRYSKRSEVGFRIAVILMAVGLVCLFVCTVTLIVYS